jgi:hypothetical protein
MKNVHGLSANFSVDYLLFFPYFNPMMRLCAIAIEGTDANKKYFRQLL